ncbi:hypothetical protein BD408DRAFT_421376 [Parasitella parasitica]|nr:hypothetical protein BD408DRAFT_421376 [Parasitella parasitica]
MNRVLSPTKPVSIAKRQADATSVVHITITAAGTVVYTQTATSYSYVPSYSSVPGSDSTLYPTNKGTNNNNNSNDQSGADHSGSGGDGEVNIGAIVGGVVGGVAFIALIGLVFFFMRRSQKRKREQQKNDLVNDDDDSYYRGHQRHSSAGIEGAGATGITSLSPAPRHLVAPLAHIGEREGDGRESKHYQDGGGYYDDVVTTIYPQQAFYSGNDSVAASDSLSSPTVEPYSATGFRQVPNEVDNGTAASNARHVPHLKDSDATTVEPPHSRD